MSAGHFLLLGLEPQFDLDPAALESAYFHEQRLSHPDRFVGKPPEVRQAALLRSVDVNQAYHTLKNPLTRAQYLLQLQGITIGTEHDSIKPTPQLLMDTMEWREQVDEAKDAKALEKLDGSLNFMVSQSIGNISQAYRSMAWETMAHETLRLGYLLKACEAVMQQKKRLEAKAS